MKEMCTLVGDGTGDQLLALWQVCYNTSFACAILCLCVTMCTQHSCTCLCDRESGRKRQCIQSGSFLICRHYIPFHWFPGLWRTGFRRGKICERSGQTGHGDAGLWIWTARGTTKISSRVLWLHRRWGQALFFLERVSRSTHLMFSQCYLKKSMANPLWRFCAIVDSLTLVVKGDFL